MLDKPVGWSERLVIKVRFSTEIHKIILDIHAGSHSERYLKATNVCVKIDRMKHTAANCSRQKSGSVNILMTTPNQN